MRRCLRGFLHLALCGVEHGQIVVRLWQVGDVTCQRAKDVYGQIVLLLFCGDHTLQKAHMYVVAVAAQVCLRKRCRFGQLALGHELIDFGDGRGGKACAGKSQGRQCQTGSAPARQRASATSVASRYVRDRRGKTQEQGAYKRISQQHGNSEGVNESLLQGRSYETFTLFLNFVCRWIACAVGFLSVLYLLAVRVWRSRKAAPGAAARCKRGIANAYPVVRVSCRHAG